MRLVELRKVFSTRGATSVVGRGEADVVAVDSVDLEVADGEFFAMLGPSGSGKTTVLRMIAGFEQPTSGEVHLGGRDVTRDAPFDRDVNTVFQDYALFPHMSVQRERRVRPARSRASAATSDAPAPTRRWRASGSRASADAGPASSPAGSGSGSPWPAPWSTGHGAAARRAARRSRPQAARGDAGRAQGDPARRRHHLPLRHPRPGGGADDERPDRGLQPGPDRAGRHRARGLRAAGVGVRRRLRRDVEPAQRRRRPSGARRHRRRLGAPGEAARRTGRGSASPAR